MTRCFGYVRPLLSPKGISVKQQRKDILEFYYHLPLVGCVWGTGDGYPAPHGWFEDEPSAFDFLSRKAMFAFLAVARPGDHLVVARAAIGFRSARDLLNSLNTLADRGIHLHVLGMGFDTAAGGGRAIVAGFADFFRDLMSEVGVTNTSKAKPWLQKPKLGFKTAGRGKKRTFVPNPKEREIMGWIVAWKQAGWSWKDIFFHLARNKVKFRGREWPFGTIRKAYAAELRLRRLEPNTILPGSGEDVDRAVPGEDNGEQKGEPSDGNQP